MITFIKTWICGLLVLSLALQTALAETAECKHHTSKASASEQQFSYTVRGIVRGLPGEGRAKNEILVKHEPIPDYRDEGGTSVGMAAMTMPFYLADKLAAPELKVGDKVEMVLEQHIGARFREEVVSIKRLAD
jgi:Cu/Ag efflux protein CusF